MTDVIAKILGAVDPATVVIVDEEDHPMLELDENEKAEIDARVEPGYEVVDSQTAEMIAAQEEIERFNEIQQFVNSNIRDIIVQGMENLKDVLDVMSSSEDPKMYQAGASYLKTLVDTNKTLFEVNKPQTARSTSSPKEGEGVQAVQINNNVTYKTTAEMLAEED